MGGGCGNLCEVGGSCLIKINFGFGRSKRGGKVKEFGFYGTIFLNIRDKLSLRGRRKKVRGRGEGEKCETYT